MRQKVFELRASITSDILNPIDETWPDSGGSELSQSSWGDKGSEETRSELEKEGVLLRLRAV